MPARGGFRISRRRFLAAGGVVAIGMSLPSHRVRASREHGYAISARRGNVALVGGAYPDTAVWSYNATVPGPELRVRQGDRLRVTVDNGLDEETTVHWHGIRVPNSMDGVPHLTQKPISPGGSFVYEFELPDAGTYWYHPHQRSFEQVGRGLYGPLIVEEREPIAVDRDVTWMLDDWRLADDASITGDFADMHDVSHNGRIGNTVTVNGRIPETFAVRSGERIRLRLVNAANARIFQLRFAGHRPIVIAYDGQPVAPHEAPDRGVVLGPAMRADLVLDMTGEPGQRFTVVDRFYEQRAYRLLDLVYGAEPLRRAALDAPVALAANTMPEPDLGAAERHDITLGGGAMSGMRSAIMGGRWVDIREMMHNGMAWAINGVVATGHVMDPLVTLTRGRTYILNMVNDTAWDHPMHLHGHAFRVIRRNGQPTPRREWQDTVLVSPRERVEIAFVADNPGNWMFHCHILEHQAAGMMGVVLVT